jgi:hypothetical protein
VRLIGLRVALYWEMKFGFWIRTGKWENYGSNSEDKSGKILKCPNGKEKGFKY